MSFFCYSSSLNVCVAYIFLFWIVTGHFIGKQLSVWLSASDVSIRV